MPQSTWKCESGRCDGARYDVNGITNAVGSGKTRNRRDLKTETQ
jgi:hypothetical protein